MRQIKYYVACSVDGFIAHTNGGLDGFCFEGEAVADYLESLNNFEVVLMGRKTYEIGLQAGKTDPYPMLKSIVFSTTLQESPHPNVEIVANHITQRVRQLKQASGKDIYLCGGAALASTLLANNLIDQLILKINPFLMGTGISLFNNVIPQTALTLIHHTIYDNGIVILQYKVTES